MTITTNHIKDVLIIQPSVFEDERGYFFESFNEQKFESQTGFKPNFIQDNESLSVYGTLRGLHFQKPPFTQAKLVRVVLGKVLDIIVDLRKDSSTYGSTHAEILSAENKTQLYVPRGFGHGFVVLSKQAVFSYKADNYYSKEADSGVMWNDPEFDIEWQISPQDIILSEKDKKLQSFETYKELPVF